MATQNAPASEPAVVASDRAGGRSARMPLEHLTLEETLRVMDVARELRDQRQTAEEMFRRDDVRAELRRKLVQQSRMTGQAVTEAEIDVAIDQYLETLHTYSDPPAGWQSFVAHAWVHRVKLFVASAVTAAAAGGFWWFFT